MSWPSLASPGSYLSPMDELSQLAALPPQGEADAVPQSLLTAFPEQAKTLGLLYDVSRELTSILDREELLRRIAERVKKIVNYDVFTVMLWNEKAQILEGVFAMHYENSIPSRFRVNLNQGITGHAAASRKPIRLDDVRLDPRYITCPTCEVVSSELVIPLLLQDRLVGVLDLESKRYAAFTEQHERMLMALGSFVAIALENSRLYNEARENHQRLQLDLDTAREIQLQLLPRGAREIPGLDLTAAYVPARELGGDFYDFLPYGEGRLALALGDVAGKATGAALHGSLAIGILRGYAMDHSFEPDGILERINGHLIRPGLDNRFVAMAFGGFDARDRSLVIANAGFTRPHLVRNGQVEEIPVEGLPLGLIRDARYQQTRVTLEEGDVLVFCSDGLHECLDKEGEEFGLKRVKALLRKSASEPAGEIANRLLHSTERHATGNGEASDDRTVVVLKVTTPSRT